MIVFYKRFLFDFPCLLNLSMVCTKVIMPPKRARVSAECAIANIMRLMDDDDNSDSDSDDGEIDSDVESDLDSLYGETGQ